MIHMKFYPFTVGGATGAHHSLSRLSVLNCVSFLMNKQMGSFL